MENMRRNTGLAIELFAARVQARESRHQSLIPQGEPFRMMHRMAARRAHRRKLSAQLSCVFTALLLAASALSAQDTPPAEPPAQPGPPSYTPKYHGDPARSDSESAALAYTRVVMRAQMLFKKHYGHYATSLPSLVHTGTFTQRMVNPSRGDYTAGFKGKTDSYIFTMTPGNLDAQHRSFYATDDGKIHAEETKPADGDSPVVETHRW